MIHQVASHPYIPNMEAHIGGIPSDILDKALDRVLEYLYSQNPNLDPNQVYVESFEHVLWKDGSLGCPKEGEFYDQAITPGYKIKIAAGNGWYTVHTDANGSRVILVRP